MTKTAIVKTKTGSIVLGHLQSSDQNYNTPEEILRPIRKFYGGKIDLDPHSNMWSTVNASEEWVKPSTSNRLWLKQQKILTEAGEYVRPFDCGFGFRTDEKIVRRRNGTFTSWLGYGNVFDNPPYGDALPKVTHKAATDGPQIAESGFNLIQLVPSRTDTRWFRANVLQADLICFTPRMGFLLRGVKTNAATGGCLLAWWGPPEKRDQYISIFRKEGWILDPKRGVVIW